MDNILQAIHSPEGVGHGLAPSAPEVIRFLESLPFRGFFRERSDIGYYPVLNRLVARFGSRSILEIGVFRGMSACAMVWQNPVTRYVGVDTETYMAASLRQAWDNLMSFQGVQDLDFEIQRGQSREVKVADLGLFDLVYVDGDHSFHNALEDLRQFWPAVAPGGRMMADDAMNLDWPEVVEAVMRFSNEIEQEPEFVATVGGTAIWRKP